MRLGRIRIITFALIAALTTPAISLATPGVASAGTAGGTVSGLITVDGSAVDNTDGRYSVALVDTTYTEPDIVGTVEVSGSYTFSAVPDGDYWVRATNSLFNVDRYHPAAEYEWDATTVSVTGGSSETTKNVDFPALEPFTVTVADDGTPAANAQVAVQSDDPYFYGFASTDIDGIGSFGVPTGASVRIEVTPEFQPVTSIAPARSYHAEVATYDAATQVAVPSGGASVSVEVPNGGLSGTVTANGATLGALSLMAPDGGEVVYRDFGGSSFYSVGSLAAATYDVNLWVDGNAIKVAEHTSDGATSETLDLVVPTGSITGVVSDGSGPIDGDMTWVEVVLYDAAETWLTSTNIDASGTFSFNYLADGDYYVRTSLDGSDTWFDGSPDFAGATGINVDGDESVANITLIERPTISGRVTAVGGAGIENVAVNIQGDSGGTYVWTDPNGDYSGTVDPGTYRISFDPPNGPFTWLGSVEFEEDSPEITVDVGSPSSGNDIEFPTGGFIGTISDGTDPVPWASVSFNNLGGGANVFTSSDENGQFAISYVPAGDYSAYIDGFSFGPFTTNGVDITPITIELPDGSISGTVTRDGAGVEHFNSVRAELLTTGQQWEMWPDTNGTYTISQLPDGQFRMSTWNNGLEVFHPSGTDPGGATIVTITDGADLTGVDIELPFSDGSISGTVTSGGSTVSDVRVVATALDGNERGTAWTGPDGTYTIENLGEGPHRVAVDINADRFWHETTPGTPASVSITEADPDATGVDIELPGGGFTGILLDAAGNVLPGTSIEATSSSPDYRFRLGSVDAVTGRFTVPFLPAGSYQFRINLPDGGSFVLDTFTATGGTPDDLGTINLPGGAIAGTVLEEGGPMSGVVGYRVTVEAGGVYRNVGVDSAGDYRIDHLPDGDYRVSASPDSGGMTRYHEAAFVRNDATIVPVAGALVGDVDVDVLPAPGAISGVVRRADDGQPIDGIEVVAFRGYGNSLTTATGLDGSYSFDDLEPGGYFVTIPVGNDRSIQLPEFQLTSPTFTRDDIDFDLPTGGFSGVVDLGGADPSGFRLQVSGAATASVSLDATGAFSFDFLPAGTYTFSVNIDGGSRFAGTAITDGSNPTTGLTLALPTGSISGDVVQNGAAFAVDSLNPVTLWLYDSNGQVVATDYRSDAASYDFQFLTPGDYRIRAIADRAVGLDAFHPNATELSQATPVAVGTTDVTDIDITLPNAGSITGTVTGPDGQPLPEGQAQLLAANGDLILNGFDNAQASIIAGSYEFPNVAVGEYRLIVNILDPAIGRLVRVDAPGVFDPEAASPVTVQNELQTVTDIDVPAPSTISGRVTDAADAGIAGVTVSLSSREFFGEDLSTIATTDSNGDYTSVPFLGGAPVIRFDAPAGSGLAPQYYDGAPDRAAATAVPTVPGGASSGIDAQLLTPSDVTVRVVDGAGAAQRAFVRLLPAGASAAEAARSSVTGSETNANGRATFVDVAPGDWIAVAFPAHSAWENVFANTFSGDVLFFDDAVPFTVGADTALTVDLEVQPGRSLNGVVTGPDGNPVPGVEVNNWSTNLLYPETQNPPPFFGGRRTFTGADGSYTLSGLTPGPMVPYFWATSETRALLPEFNPDVYEQDDVVAVDIPASGPVDDIDIQFERSSTIVATVSDDIGQITPIAGGFDTWNVGACRDPLVPIDSGYYVGCSESIFGNFGVAAGSATLLTGLTPGDYNVAGVLVGSSPSQRTDLVSITVGTDELYTCDLFVEGAAGTSTCTLDPDGIDGAISGVVTGPDGSPAPGVRVTARQADAGVNGLALGSGFSAIDGSYEIDGLLPGDYVVQASPPFEGPYGFASFDEYYSLADDAWSPDFDAATPVTVADTEVTGIDIALDARVTGFVRLDPAPSDGFSVAVCPVGYEPVSFYGQCYDPVTDDNSSGVGFGSTTGSTARIESMQPGTWDIFTITNVGVGGTISEPYTFTLPKLHTYECDLNADDPLQSVCHAIPLDDDGVDEAEESAAPNEGDGNGDGASDADQSHVASVEDGSVPDPDETGANFVTLAATTGGAPAPLRQVAIAPTPTTPPPSGSTPQTGLVNFGVSGLAIDPVTPAVAEVELFLPAPANEYLKYDGDTDTWTDATSIATFDPTSTLVGGVERWRVVLTIEDGSEFDEDGVVNGQIDDPGVFALAPAGTITGTVQTTAGDPIENVTVTVITDAGLGDAVETDADGEYSFELDPGDYQLSFEVPGGPFTYFGGDTLATATVITLANRATETADLSLPDVGFTGRILDGTDGVDLPVQITDDAGEVTTVFADGNGVWTVQYLPEGTYTFDAADIIFATSAGVNGVITDLGDFALPDGEVTGTVSVGGVAVDGNTDFVPVLLVDESTGQERLAAALGDGTYRFDWIPAGTYTVSAQVDGATVWHLDAVTEADATDVVVGTSAVTADIDLPVLATLAGTVTETGTGGLVGATVRVLDDTREVASTATGAGGAWSIDLLAGTYTIEVISLEGTTFSYDVGDDGTPDEVVATSGATTSGLDVAIPGGRLGGTITLDGAAFADETVLITPTAGGAGLGVETGAAGSWSVVHVPDGEYAVSVGGREIARATIVDGGDVTDLDVDLPTGSIAGVATENGEFFPLGPATADSLDLRDATTNALVATFAESTGGPFVFEFVPDGSYVVDLVIDGVSRFHPGVDDRADATVVQVIDGNAVTGVDIALPLSAGSIAGTITDADGVVVTGATVVLQPIGGAEESTSTAPGGGYAFSGLGENTYRVVLRLPAGDIELAREIELSNASTSATGIDGVIPDGTDLDGVDDTEEDGAPNGGDGNDDGVPDADQSSVASVEDPSVTTGNTYITVSASSGGDAKPLANVRVVAPPSSSPTGGATTQSGLISFDVNDLTVGATATVEVFLPTKADRYFKYDVDTDTWTDATSIAAFDATATTIGGIDRWRVVLSIVDGGPFDDDGAADGRVSDPGVFALSTTDGGTGGGTDGGSTDGGTTDGGSTGGGSTDGGTTDGGSTDGGSTDGGTDDPLLVSVDPGRVAETRSCEKCATVDGRFLSDGMLRAGQIYEIEIGGRANVPPDATAAFVNLTAVRPTAGGHLTAFPCGVDTPQASNVNYAPGQVVANAALVKLSGDGKLCVFTHAPTHLIVDVNGFVPAGGTPTPIEPGRVVETRSCEKCATVDGKQLSDGMLRAGQIYEVQIGGRANVPDDADAAYVNLTAVRPTAPGHLTAFPCGVTTPQASNVNYRPGGVTPNAALVKLSDDGKLCVYAHSPTHLIVDVNGFVPAGSTPTPLDPGRVAETRSCERCDTVDGKQLGDGMLRAEQIYEIQIAGRANVPDDATAAFVNLTAVRPTAPGHLTAFPCGVDTPTASNVNYRAGDVRANAALVKLSDDGKLCVYAHSPTHLIVDVNGFVPAP